MAGRAEGSSCVQFRFKSSNAYDTLWFDGTGISVNDLKARIMEQKQLLAGPRGGSKSDQFDLAVANAQTGEEYADTAVLIPRNTALVVRRVPLYRQSALASKQGVTELGAQGRLRRKGDPEEDPGAPEAAAPAADRVGDALTIESILPRVRRALVCGLCGELFSAAVALGCCGASFCDDCARLHMERTGSCPGCRTPAGRQKILPNKPLRQVVGRYRALRPVGAAAPQAPAQEPTLQPPLPASGTGGPGGAAPTDGAQGDDESALMLQIMRQAGYLGNS